MPASTAHEASTDQPMPGALPDDTEPPTIRPPAPGDAAQAWTLVRESGVLDLNSPYAYLLQLREFADTSLVATRGDRVLGFVMAFRPPRRPEAVFVWQIGVRAEARGQGLARRLLLALLQRTAPQGVRFLESTITPSNLASSKLFRGVARRVGATCEESVAFGAEEFPDGHEPEVLYRIGPIDPARLAPSTAPTAPSHAAEPDQPDREEISP